MAVFFKSQYFVLSLVFLIFLSLFIFSGFLFYLKPVIYEISPMPASHENVIVVKGRNLGDKIGEININDHYLMKSSIVSWSNEKIVFKITDEINSGLVFIKSEKGISNELFLVISRQVPIKLEKKNKPFLFVTDELVLMTNVPVILRGKNLVSNFAGVEIFIQTKHELYKVLPRDILKLSEEEIKFIPPKTLHIDGEIFLQVDGVESNKIPFNFNINFFKWNLKRTKNFKISHEIYFVQAYSKELSLTSDDINFNVFYLNPIENERQKIKFSDNNGAILDLDNLFFKSLKSNTYHLKFEVETCKLDLDIFDRKALESIKVNTDSNMYEFKTYVLNKRDRYLSYDSLDLSSINLNVNNKDSAYELAKSIIDALILHFTVVDNDLTLDESIKVREISADNLILLTNLLFLRNNIPLRNAVGLYFDNRSSSLKEHTWCEFFLEHIGFIYFDIVNAVLFRDSSNYFLSMSENYIQYGYKEDYDDLLFDDYFDLLLLKYKSLTNSNYSLNYRITLEENINDR
ncbi:DNA-binding protein [Borrelia venezuelensis]|uniref:DNA-binding protein n=1 Tax=Borrelia venezuelensis TaxID=1653839 RepID=UPI001FF6D4E5|nr:DNA-binding protein [Borrelia venezuelensis]UPA12259.1 DNA-binding protein [Borrelia venezuelensis]